MDKNKYTMHSASFVEYIFFRVAELLLEKAEKFGPGAGNSADKENEARNRETRRQYANKWHHSLSGVNFKSAVIYIAALIL